MLNSRKTSPVHEELFIQHYRRLFSWALQLTHNDQSQAEDLLHDAFIQFTITQPDLARIHNLDGYLYGMLRNLHLSQVRKATRSRLQQLSIVEYESAETGLRTIDPRDLIHIQDQLRHICQFVCVRKNSARTASILILRFFQGYYPSEIVQVLQTTYQAVKVRLRLARLEAKASLENPKSLIPLDAKAGVEILPANFARTSGDLLSELRAKIFNTREGDCLPASRIRELYRGGQAPVETEDLAHIVSCASCLDEVNKLLGLPLLAERYPVDSIERDKGPRGGTPGGGASSGGVAAKHWRRGAREVFEHDPQELCVSVNGYMQGSHRLNSELSELTLDIDLKESIDFIEIFSEQQVRLLLMNVDEPPPGGPGEQAFRLLLSQGRTLEVHLRFSSPWPTLHVAYHDPTFTSIDSFLESGAEHAALDAVRAGESAAESVVDEGRQHRVSDLGAFLEKFRALVGSIFTKPAAVTAIAAFMIIAALLLTLRRAPEVPLTAVALLERARAAEAAITARTDQVLHRTIDLEERRARQTAGLSDAGELISRRRIEVWQSAESGITARRLYDDKNQLLGGDWRRSDGGETLYHHGAKPEISSRQTAFLIRNFDNVWQVDLSAQTFSLIADPQQASIEERGNVYLISVKSADGSAPAANESAIAVVKSASLVLSRADLHAIAETLVIQQGAELREYRLMEASLELRPPATVAPLVFEPDASLLSSSILTPTTPATTSSPAVPGAQPTTPFVATTAQEIEVLRLLNSVGADLGQEVSVERSASGGLLIQGVVDTDRRKSEILQALRPVSGDPALKIVLITTAEAARRQAGSSNRENPSEVQQTAPAENKTPAQAELERYFTARGLSGEQLNLEVQRFSERVLSRSRQMLLRAGALNRLAARFSAEELRTLDDGSRAKWLALIHSHAAAIQRENSLVREELAQVFSSASINESSVEISVHDDAAIFSAAKHLFDLCAQTDHSISAAFVLSSGGGTSASIKTPQFWRTLAGIDRQAIEIEKAASRK